MSPKMLGIIGEEAFPAPVSPFLTQRLAVQIENAIAEDTAETLAVIIAIFSDIAPTFFVASPSSTERALQAICCGLAARLSGLRATLIQGRLDSDGAATMCANS